MNCLLKKFGGEMNLVYKIELKNNVSILPKINLGFNTENCFFSTGINLRYKIIE